MILIWTLRCVSFRVDIATEYRWVCLGTKLELNAESVDIELIKSDFIPSKPYFLNFSVCLGKSYNLIILVTGRGGL
jgi:hypothetical protein